MFFLTASLCSNCHYAILNNRFFYIFCYVWDLIKIFLLNILTQFFSCDAETLLISLHIKEIGFQETSFFGERTPIAHCAIFTRRRKSSTIEILCWYLIDFCIFIHFKYFFMKIFGSLRSHLVFTILKAWLHVFNIFKVKFYSL